jgi:hypothetical protein
MLKLRQNVVDHCGAVDPIKPVAPSSSSDFEGGCGLI